MKRISKKWLLLGAVAVVVIYYMYGGTKKTTPHARPLVGRGYGTTPYGSPAGNPGRLTMLNPTSKQGCHSCGGGGGCTM